MTTNIKIDSSRIEKWSWLTQFVDDWCPPRTHVAKQVRDIKFDGVAGLPIPIAVREWYHRFSNRMDIWCAQDKFLPSEEIYVEGDFLVFLVETQGVVQWAIPKNKLESDDPLVILDMCDLSEDRYAESSTFSEFAVSFALHNYKFVADHVASGSFAILSDSPQIKLFRSSLLTRWHWPTFPTSVTIWNGSVIEMQGQVGEKCWLTLASRDERSHIENLEKLSLMGINLTANG